MLKTRLSRPFEKIFAHQNPNKTHHPGQNLFLNSISDGQERCVDFDEQG